jgi:hypothetical protein
MAWWKGEDSGRPLFYACVDPQRSQVGPPAPSSDPSLPWLDTKGILQREEARFLRSSYPAEGFPAVSACLGPGSLAAMLGCKPLFQEDTVWYESCIPEPSLAHLALDPQNPWWRWTRDFTAESVRRGKGRFLTEIPDLIENLDTLASLLGAENLFYAFRDEPDEVLRLQEELLKVWCDVFDRLYRMVRDDDGGMSFGGFGIWAPGRFSKIQCDLAAMVSKEDYDRFALPYFKAQAEWLDYSVYHLDGPNALQTFDSMLSIDRIGAVQWQPGSMNPKAWDPCWDFVYEKILSSGKSILTLLPVETDSDVRKLEAFVKRIGRKRLLVLTEPHPTDPLRMAEIVRDSAGW